jgi:hypothetical protein
VEPGGGSQNLTLMVFFGRKQSLYIHTKDTYVFYGVIFWESVGSSPIN